MIKDEGRSTETAMRDLLRRFDRELHASRPVRPTDTEPPPEVTLTALDGSSSDGVVVGDWVLTQHPTTGALMATDTTTGTATTLATREGQ